MDRARSNYETFKNHTSILFWSLGNESYAGDDIEAMNMFMNDMTIELFSYFDTGKRKSRVQPERFYHGFVLGLLVELT